MNFRIAIKKGIIALFIVAFAAVMFSSCASTQYGCPNNISKAEVEADKKV